jgi:hypothetical protein
MRTSLGIPARDAAGGGYRLPMPRRALAALFLTLALVACNDDSPAEDGAVDTVSSSAAAAATVTASHDSSAGAMTGLLEAMRAGDNAAVQTWVSPDPPADRESVTQVLRLQGLLGGDGTLFWLVDSRTIVEATDDGDKGEVRLDGYLVWCTGQGADDTDASCAQPNGKGDAQSTTYETVRVDGQWYVHLDLNHGELVDANPGPAGVAG